jgi:hypothetical protein
MGNGGSPWAPLIFAGGDIFMRRRYMRRRRSSGRRRPCVRARSILRPREKDGEETDGFQEGVPPMWLTQGLHRKNLGSHRLGVVEQRHEWSGSANTRKFPSYQLGAKAI